MAVGTTVVLKVRRGTYDALVNDRQKMSVGEPCAVLSGDPSVPSGKAFYICFEAGDVRRMVSIEDLEIMVSRGDFKGEKGDEGRGIKALSVNAQSHLIVTLTDDTRVDAGYILDILERIDASEQLRIQAEKDRASAEQGRATAEAARRTAETGRDAAERARISNEDTRTSDEAVRIADEAAREASETMRSANEAARVSNETAREQAEQARRTAEQARDRLWTESLKPAVEQAVRDADAAADNADAVADDLISRRDAGDFKGDRGDPFTYADFTADQLAALKGETGSRGVGVASVERTSGNGAAGSTDTYTITLTDGSTSTFTIYNGADGQGAGDMLKAVYDTKGKNQDIFDYVDGSLDGKADLRDGKVPSSQLPSMDYVPASEKGSAEGVATLGADGKVPSDQIPSLDYIPVTEKGAGGGVATLGDDGKVPSGQLPSLDNDPAGSVSEHNVSPTAHEDIRDDMDTRFSSLSAVATSGSYDDLTGAPAIPAGVRVKGDAESAYRTGDVNITASDIGLGNVDDTSDVDKPISTAQQAALDEKVSKAGDTMTGGLIIDGGLSFTDNEAVPMKKLDFLLGVERFTDGGGVIFNRASTLTVGNAGTVGGKTVSELQDYRNLTNRPPSINLLKDGIALTDTYWIKEDCTITGGQADPDGNNYASLYTPKYSSGKFYINRDTNLPNLRVGRMHTISVWVRVDSPCSFNVYAGGAAFQITLSTNEWTKRTLPLSFSASVASNTSYKLFGIAGGNSVYIYNPEIFVGSSTDIV